LRRIVDRYAAIVRQSKPDLAPLDWEELAMKVTTPFDSAVVIEQLDRVLRNDLESLMDERRLNTICATVAKWTFVERVAAVDEIERCRLKTIMPVLGERSPVNVDKKGTT
jgi:hypothetical protein